MLIWTIYPAEVVFASGEASTSSWVEVTQGERVFMVSLQPDGRKRIERLISSNPMDYLNPQWQPGQIL